jgi:hypothetical protein
MTPLHAAATNGDTDLVALLLERGAHIDALGRLSCTPLFLAVEKNLSKMVIQLLEAGADMNFPRKAYSTLFSFFLTIFRDRNQHLYHLPWRRGCLVLRF